MCAACRRRQWWIPHACTNTTLNPLFACMLVTPVSPTGQMQAALFSLDAAIVQEPRKESGILAKCKSHTNGPLRSSAAARSTFALQLQHEVHPSFPPSLLPSFPPSLLPFSCTSLMSSHQHAHRTGGISLLFPSFPLRLSQCHEWGNDMIYSASLPSFPPLPPPQARPIS